MIVKPTVALRVAGALSVGMALVLAVFMRPASTQESAGATPQQIPALLDVPVGLAPTHAELTAWHDRLLGERNALRAQVASQRARCSSVEQGSAEDAACIDERGHLAAAVDTHIRDSNAFDAAVRQAKGVCVKTAGYQLVIDMRDCQNNRPSTMSYACLEGTGISEKSLGCLAAARSPNEATLAACGLTVASIPIDAAIHCEDIDDVCVTRALQSHKDGTAKCLH